MDSDMSQFNNKTIVDLFSGALNGDDATVCFTGFKGEGYYENLKAEMEKAVVDFAEMQKKRSRKIVAGKGIADKLQNLPEFQIEIIVREELPDDMAFMVNRIPESRLIQEQPYLEAFKNEVTLIKFKD